MFFDYISQVKTEHLYTYTITHDIHTHGCAVLTVGGAFADAGTEGDDERLAPG